VEKLLQLRRAMKVSGLNVKPTILKLGGSVITHKEKPLTINRRAIRRLAQEISQANISPLAIVHGGGSFGHPIAKKYRINEGFKDSSQIIGFSKTHQAMTKLNKIIIDALISHNIPAVTIQPSSFIITKSDRIKTINNKIVEKLLETGFVPVLYGDAVLDSDMGFAILSGDQLVSFLATQLSADRIIIGVDVDGLYTSDPKKDKTAKLMQHITLQELKKMQHRIRGATVTDVTGGMLGKMSELIPAVGAGISVLIVNASKPDNVYKALKGQKVVGTLIE
jgi:isopentenyl phosphate kinase